MAFGLRQRLEQSLYSLLRKSAPVSALPAEPLSGLLGASAVGIGISDDPFQEPPPNWSHDASSDEALPVGVVNELPPHRYRSARIAARHGWFAALARRHAMGDRAAGEQAVEAMEGWLRQDLPGQGIAWAHASDLAIRMIHWHAGLGWLKEDAPARLREALAGSAHWHLRHLELRRPMGPADGLRRVLHACGLVVGGFTFPGLPESRSWWSEGLSALRWELSKQMHDDGVGRDRALAWQAQVLWAVAIARAVTRANGGAFPADVDVAFARGTRFLADMAGEIGTLPALGEEPPPDLLQTSTPLAWTLRNLALAWGLDQGEAAPGAAADPRLGWLRAEVSAKPATWSAKNWAVWSYRQGGIAAAWTLVKNQPSRVVLDAGNGRGSPLSHLAPLNLLWQVGGIQVLADPGTGSGATDLCDAVRSPLAHNILRRVEGTDGGTVTLDRARVDGKKARIEASISGQGIARDVLLNQSRLIVTDLAEGPVQLTWQLGPGWRLEKTAEGWTGKNENLTLILQLSDKLEWRLVEGQPMPEPLGWVWAEGWPKAAPCLIGVGQATGEIVSSFEVR